MELAKYRIPVRNRNSLVKLYPIGDSHLCAPACDEKALARTVELIANDPDAYWIGIGDYADCILPGDPRWTLRAIDLRQVPRDSKGRPDITDLASWQVNKVDEAFAPIWHKCLGLLEGNHEQAMYKWYHTDLTRQLVRRRNVAYLGQTALVRLEFELAHGKGHHELRKLDVFAEHGAAGGGTDGNAINNMQQRAAQFDADIYYKGHVHKRGSWEKTALAWGQDKPRIRRRLGVLTGTYLKSYTDELTYSEQKAYPPAEIGGTCTLIRPFAGELQSVNVETLSLLRR